MSYRIEISPNNRAGCTATHCKSEGVKILKGEIRHGVLVTIKEHSSMKYRHWGCVTPTILHNWWETAEGNFELIDGFEELPDEAADKVKRALEQGHVDDEDWNGDVECNRFVEGKKQQGMFLKKGKAKKGDEENADEDEDKKPAGKKRGRPAKKEAVDDEDEDEKPTAKKARGTKKTVNEDADEAAPAKKGRGRPKKVASTDGAADEEEEVAAPAKRGRGRPRKSDAAEPAAQEAEPTPKRGRGRPKKVVSTDGAADKDEDEVVEKPKKGKGRGRPKKAAPVSEEGEDDDE